jgi:transposase-like protein
MFHRGEPLTETVWEKLMLGLSTRKYGQAVREFTEAYGLEKSAVSEHFIEASRTKLKEMMERRLDKTRMCALLIDATPFEGQQMVAALGIGEDGREMILGIRQGATENATVAGELLGDLVERGLDFTPPRLYVLDGGKALTAAVKKHAGESAAIQRCQVHKRRNVLDHLTDEQKPGVAKRLKAAYALEDYAAAKQARNQLHRELMDINPSAARSLGEGMEETLTVRILYAAAHFQHPVGHRDTRRTRTGQRSAASSRHRIGFRLRLGLAVAERAPPHGAARHRQNLRAGKEHNYLQPGAHEHAASRGEGFGVRDLPRRHAAQ